MIYRIKLMPMQLKVVALMGAHSLGRCSEDNSGYIGPWLAGKDGSTLDNTFFNQMINDSFTYTSRVANNSITECLI